jgi:hypothetical protein
VADVLRRFFARLGEESIAQLLTRAGLPGPDFDGLKPQQRTKAAVEAALNAEVGVRSRIEAIAGTVVSLSDRGDHAELALRAACEYHAHLLEKLESDRSLEERILEVWSEQPHLLDRARNLAMSFAWRDSRYQCSFQVQNPNELAANLDEAVEAMRHIVQSLQGGRRVHAEAFTYADVDRTPIATSPSAGRVHHVALYLETPASYLMEFQEGEVGAVPVLRRQAKEMAIDYNAATGRLDVTGKGVGGSRVLSAIANEFRILALADSSLTALERSEWSLDMFLCSKPPHLAPPDGFSSVRVTEIILRSQRQYGAKTVFRGPDGGSAYDRLAEHGLNLAKLSFEWVSSATLALNVLPETDDEESRSVEVTLGWPNTLSFDGAGLEDRRQIRAWLEQGAFVPPHQHTT